MRLVQADLVHCLDLLFEDGRIRPGEVVALLGRSGSGKSTLLRILAGLIQPSSGRVLVKGMPLKGPNSEVAMVFQSFALLPWLTVQENAELGLFARGVPQDTTEKEATLALAMVGLEGFEGAYPKELSGGHCHVGRKKQGCGHGRKRCACSGDLKRFIRRSRCRVG